MAFPVINPCFQFFDDAGEPLDSGTVETYEVNSVTPKVTYQNEALSTPNEAIIDLDGAGRCSMYVADGSAYKYIVKDAEGNVMDSKDYVRSPVGTAAGIGALLYPRSAAEISALVTPTDYAIPSHDVVGYIDPRRYAFIYDSTDAATGNDAALVKCISVAEASGCKRIFFIDGTGWISAVFNLDQKQDYTICGVNQFVSVLRLTTGAANGTHVLRLGQFCCVENIWIRGNWAEVTLGQLGVGIFAQDTTAGYIHGTNLWNVQVTHCKSHGIHEIDGAYHRGYNVISDTHGLDPIYLEGQSAGQSTTAEYTGKNVFSSCLNGHVHVKNLFSSQFRFISEFTRGVMREGSCSLLTWMDCHFEQVVTLDSAGGAYTSNYIYNSNGGGCSNETITRNYLGMLIATAAIEGDANYSGDLINNRNLTAQVLVDAYQGNWWPKGVISTRNSQYATVGNVGAGEDTLLTYTLPAGALATDGDAVEITVFGKTAANANNKTLKIHFGGTVIYNSGALAANDDDWKLIATIIRSGASAQRTGVSGTFNNAAAGGTSSSANENTTAAIIIKVTGEGTATDDITGLGWMVKFSDYVP